MPFSRELVCPRHEARRAQGLAHIVVSGSGYLKTRHGTRHLQAGDVVFFPRTAEHVLSSDIACANEADTPQVFREGAFTVKESGAAGDGGMNLFCARFEYDAQAELVAGLPETLYLNIAAPSLSHLVSLLQGEAENAMHGSTAAVNALSTVLLVLIVRHYLGGQNAELPPGVFGGWRDRRLNHLIQTLLDAPEKDWDIDGMAQTANLSRAHLMRLFRQQTGSSPHAFLNRIRLQQAALKLKSSADSVLSVALSCGFQSETHFGKAFKKQYGITPGQYRKGGTGGEWNEAQQDFPCSGGIAPYIIHRLV
nr:AraC family transcriptional regulator [Neisseria chenwenguii]